MRHNLWLSCYFGFLDQHDTGDITTAQNCLAYRCSYGISKYCNTPLEVHNCTLDGCWYGVYCWPGASPTLMVRHAILGKCGFGLATDSAGAQVDMRNVFWANTFSRLMGDSPVSSVADDSFRLSYSPWDRFAGRERALWYVVQDWKNLAADTGAYEASAVFGGEGICTSSRDGSQDSGRVDPGFHWAKLPDSDGDEMSDQYEAFWGISDPNANHDSDHVNIATTNIIESKGTSFPADADNPGFFLRPANGPKGTFTADFHRGPYIQLNLSNGAVVPNDYTIFWGTDDPEFESGAANNQVWYSTVAETPLDPNHPGPNWLSVAADNNPFSYVDNKDAQQQPENKFLHFAELTDLNSDTTFYYYVQSDRGGEQWVSSPIRSFHTPPNLTPPSTSSFRILAMGDNRGEQSTGNHWDHLRIAKGFLNHDSTFNYDLLFHTGDFVYDAGNDDGHEYRPQWDKHFFRPAAGFLSSHAVIAVAGDHEYRNDGTWNNGAHQFQHYFNEFHDTVDGINRLWGYWDYGNCRFVFLDTEKVWINQNETANALTWLTNVLALTGAGRWRIVLMHVPPCTDTTRHAWGDDDIARCRLNFASLFETNTVDIVIAGHSHVFERWVYDGDANGNGDDAADFQAGVNYVITGGMGATPHLYNAHNPNHPRAFPPNASQDDLSRFHYCTLEMNTNEAGSNDSTRATLRVWKTSGEEWTDARCVFTRRN
ncbi:MAG: metallophosphoesterase family protein [Acidobacteria bacterium]|nr:metallophosphoesterase family protein [Acidobacteriota bacterium]